MPEIKLLEGKARVIQLTCHPKEVLVVLTACAPWDIEDRINAHQAKNNLSLPDLGLWVQSKNWGVVAVLEGLYFHRNQETRNEN